MKPFNLRSARFGITFAVLCSFALAPVWAVDYFVNQDGSGHVNAAYVMLELIKGNPFFSNFYIFNSPFVPNSSGHWMMVPLLQMFSPFVVTKIMMSVTFLALTVAVIWVRWQTNENAEFTTSLLIGCVLSLNWLWLVGSYNFIFGLAGFSFTLGLYYRWRERMNFARCFGIVVLLAIVFASHLISFLVLAGSIAVLAGFAEPAKRSRAILWTFLALISCIPLIVFYKILVTGGETFAPAWRSLADPYSLRSWLIQIAAADPFVLISRKTLPFTDAQSAALAIFSPILWIALAFVLLVVSTVKESWKAIVSRHRLPFALLFVFSMLAVMFAPDDFGLTNGSLLRERMLLAGLVFAVPLFRVESSPFLKHAAQVCLVFVLLFQTAVLWEYSLRANDEIKDFVEVANAIEPGQSIASVVVVTEPQRFHSLPATQMNNYLGIGRDVIVLDNYEMGHYLFPVVTLNPVDKEFIFGLTTSNIVYLNDLKEDFDTNLSDLDSCLMANSRKADVMLLWGSNVQVESILRKSFDAEPFYESGRVRLFHRLK